MKICKQNIKTNISQYQNKPCVYSLARINFVFPFSSQKKNAALQNENLIHSSINSKTSVKFWLLSCTF